MHLRIADYCSVEEYGGVCCSVFIIDLQRKLDVVLHKQGDKDGENISMRFFFATQDLVCCLCHKL